MTDYELMILEDSERNVEPFPEAMFCSNLNSPVTNEEKNSDKIQILPGELKPQLRNRPVSPNFQ